VDSLRSEEIELKEIETKKAIGKSGISEYCINPYAGCQHACVYCYARFTCRFYGKRMDEWGKFVYVKKNIPYLVNIEKRILKPGDIFISSVTDPYQPLEERYKLTRRILESLLEERKFTITVQTKSNLVLRDLDIIKKFGNRIKVGVTITMEDEMAKIFEPNAPSTSERIKTLKILKENGIRTYAFLGPIIPGVSNFEWLFESVNEFSDYIYIDKLNLRPGVWQSILPVIKKIGKLEEIKNNLDERSFFYTNIKRTAMELCKKTKKECEVLY